MRLGGRVCGIYLKVACVALVILGVAVPVAVMMPAMHRHLAKENRAHGHPHHLWAASSDGGGDSDGSSADEASEESSDGGSGGGGVGTVDARRWKAIGASDVRAGDFVGLRTHSGKWVARAVETEKGGAGGGGVTHVSLAEKTWEYRPSKSGHAAFYSWCGTFLALNREPKLAAQVRTLSSDAKWTLVPVEGGGVALKGVGRDGADKYVGLVDTTKKENKGMEGYLSCRYKELEHPRTTFRLYRRVDCGDAEACWGDFLEDGKKRAAVDAQKWLGEAVPLFGSPKPFNASDELYEEYRLSYQRLVKVWSSLSSPVRPMMFVEPKDTIGNELTKREGVPLFEEFEHQKKFAQPTYRGLFSGAFARGQDLWGKQPEMAIYSNSDILYTPSLGASLASSMRFAKHRAGKAAPRLLVVGQRVNVKMPKKGQLDLDDEEAAEAALETLAKTGQRYQTNAEDYFAVSRALYDWDGLPDFVVGGVAFDNWFVGKANRDDKVWVVDGTDTILAVHQNHGKGRKDSHLHPKSKYNRELAARHGSWSKGRVVDAKYATMRTPWNEIVVVNRRHLLFD